MPLKIAITADPMLPVPPRLYGGIERIIDMLITGYLSRGHQVSLFAHKDSETKANLYPYPGGSGKLADIKNAILITKTIYPGNYDIVHSFGRLFYLLPLLPLKLPKLMSYQREPTISQINKAVKLSAKGSISFTGCSGYINNKIKKQADSYTVYNGVDLNKYSFSENISNDAPLMFLGRIEPIKGSHIAIEIAKKTNRKLIIAGNIPPEHQWYFDTKISPHLNDQIQYIGPVDDTRKNTLLGTSAALLMPIQWDEPFGIVMAEAMACGTPVIGFNRGSVPEIIIDGVTGFTCSTEADMISAVNKIDTIKRSAVRKDCEARFSSDVIIDKYLSLYQSLINRR